MAEKILFVDDEPNVLQSIKRNLRKRYELDTAESGKEALKRMDTDGPYAVIVSDMQMPKMNGAELLSAIKENYPATVRIMLTGNADQQTAIDAVNHGDILRFLNKPSSADEIAAAVDAGLTQHKLIMAEKELLEETVRGSVRALSEVMALTNPEVFGRCTRLKTRMNQVAMAMELENLWELEATALLSQIGCVSLQPALVRKKIEGAKLSPDEHIEFATHTAAGAELLGSIPRMEGIAESIRYQEKYMDGSGSPNDSVMGDDIPVGARILRAILDIDLYESSGKSTVEAIDEIKKHPARYHDAVITALEDVTKTDKQWDSLTVKISALKDDMLLAADLNTSTGTLLVAKGQQTTRSVRRHLANYQEKGLIGDEIEVWQESKMDQAA